MGNIVEMEAVETRVLFYVVVIEPRDFENDKFHWTVAFHQELDDKWNIFEVIRTGEYGSFQLNQREADPWDVKGLPWMAELEWMKDLATFSYQEALGAKEIAAGMEMYDDWEGWDSQSFVLDLIAKSMQRGYRMNNHWYLGYTKQALYPYSLAESFAEKRRVREAEEGKQEGLFLGNLACYGL